MKTTTLLIAVFFLTNLSVQAQNDQRSEVNFKKGVIDTVLSCFFKNYVYPEISRIMKDSILQKYEKGDYAQFTITNDFIDQLSNDLRRISGDKHIRIYHAESSGKDLSHQKNSLLNSEIEKKKSKNFNFKKVDWLPGNIGYIRFDVFEDLKYAQETASAAMQFISNCEAVIIDLRYNPGGKASMGKFLLSYFFSEPTLLSTQHFTRQDSIVQNWSDSHVSTYSLADKDIYILTSASTASGAEAFTYTLKNYNKAVVVGEKTRGAAHWCEYFYYSTINVEIRMPVAYPINPVTKTNWEGIGIEPDFEIDEHLAFYEAYILALEKLQSAASDTIKSQELEWYKILAKQKMEAPSTETLTDYCGVYEDIRFKIKGNYLFWDQGENEELVLIPLSKDHFVFDDSEDYIVKFVRNKKNKIIGYQLLIKGKNDNPLNRKTGELK